MMAMPSSLVVEITSQQSSLVTSSQARFLLQIRDHAIVRFSSMQPNQVVQVQLITRATACFQVRFKDAHQCADRNLHDLHRRATM
jgi:hypothetical protein